MFVTSLWSHDPVCGKWYCELITIQEVLHTIPPVVSPYLKMQPFMVQRLQHRTALTRPSSLNIGRLSPTAGRCSGSRDPQNEEDVVANGILPLRRHIQTLPLLADSSNTQKGKRRRKQFFDAEMNLSLTFAANPVQLSPATFSMENVLPTNLHGWVAGVLVASSLFVAAPVEALDEVLSLSMLDSEVTTGPITEFLLSRQEQRARDDFSDRVSEAVEWLRKGRLAQARGDFSAALNCFNQVTEKAGDLALAEYARVGHAVTLYEVGDRGQAIIEMEDVSISLKGYPEIHAALAAALYADKHAPIPAEKQFTIATLLDPRYTDLVWVQETKHWPPSLLKSLQRFISLS